MAEISLFFDVNIFKLILLIIFQLLKKLSNFFNQTMRYMCLSIDLEHTATLPLSGHILTTAGNKNSHET